MVLSMKMVHKFLRSSKIVASTQRNMDLLFDVSAVGSQSGRSKDASVERIVDVSVQHESERAADDVQHDARDGAECLLGWHAVGRDESNHAAARREHVPRLVLAAHEDAARVDREGGVELAHGRLLRRRVLVDAGVVLVMVAVVVETNLTYYVDIQKVTTYQMQVKQALV